MKSGRFWRTLVFVTGWLGKYVWVVLRIWPGMKNEVLPASGAETSGVAMPIGVAAREPSGLKNRMVGP